MSLILSAPNAAKPVIGYHNLLDEGTVVASSEATDYQGANAYDWRIDDWWKPASAGTHYLTLTLASAATADYFAVFGHNLHESGSSIKLQYSTDGSTWLDASESFAPSTGSVYFEIFDSILAGWWRLVLSTVSGPSSIGMVAFGDRLTLPLGLPLGSSIPVLQRKLIKTNNLSDTGGYLGSTVKYLPNDLALTLKAVDTGWMRPYWMPFIKHAEKKKFFFSWDPITYPNEAVFCNMTKHSHSQIDPYHMRLSLNALALAEL